MYDCLVAHGFRVVCTSRPELLSAETASHCPFSSRFLVFDLEPLTEAQHAESAVQQLQLLHAESQASRVNSRGDVSREGAPLSTSPSSFPPASALASPSPSASAEVRLLSALDDRLVAVLRAGDIRLVRRAWLLAQPKGYVMQPRQELEKGAVPRPASPPKVTSPAKTPPRASTPAKGVAPKGKPAASERPGSGSGLVPLLTPEEAVTLIRRCERSVGVVSCARLTPRHADPTGARVAALQSALRQLEHVEAVFWSFASCHQHMGAERGRRGAREEAAYQRALEVTPDMFASAVGTTVLQLKDIPPRPEPPAAERRRRGARGGLTRQGSAMGSMANMCGTGGGGMGGGAMPCGMGGGMSGGMGGGAMPGGMSGVLGVRFVSKEEAAVKLEAGARGMLGRRKSGQALASGRAAGAAGGRAGGRGAQANVEPQAKEDKYDERAFDERGS